MIIDPRYPEPPQADPVLQLFNSPMARLEFYRREIFNETSNLADRTNAYLTAQSFLLIAYASSMANLNPDWGKQFTLVVPPTLALFGVLCSLSAWSGIKAACDIIEHWHSKQIGLLSFDPVFSLKDDDNPLFSDWESSFIGQRKSLSFSKRTPWLFSGLWVFLAVFALWMNIPSPG